MRNEILLISGISIKSRKFCQVIYQNLQKEKKNCETGKNYDLFDKICFLIRYNIPSSTSSLLSPRRIYKQTHTQHTKQLGNSQ